MFSHFIHLVLFLSTKALYKNKSVKALHKNKSSKHYKAPTLVEVRVGGDRSRKIMYASEVFTCVFSGVRFHSCSIDSSVDFNQF